MNTHVSGFEHLEALSWGLLLALVTSLPYLYGLLSAPDDRYFLGFVLNAKDQNTYFMWMTQAADGEPLLRNLYTSIPHDGAMLSLIFLFGGLLTNLFGSLDVAYQVLRVLAVVLLGWSLWLFVATFVETRSERRWVYLLAVFGAGLGWVWNLARLVSGDYGGVVADNDLLTRPFDLWVPEGYVFFSMLVMPHFTAAIALLLLTVRLAALGLYEDRLGLTAIAGVMCFLLSFVHPYDVLIALGLVFGVSGLHGLRNRRIDPAMWRHALLLLLLSVGPILYNYWILNANPGMKAWLVQNKSDSPAPLSYITGYGLLLLGALGFLLSRARQLGRTLEPWQWLAVWLLILPVALYAPIDFQRRLAIAASVPMAVATGLLVLDRLQRSDALRQGKARLALLLLMLAIAAPTSAFHWLNSFLKTGDQAGELFAARDTVAALQWIGTQATPPGQTVLAGFEVGNYVPRFTGLTTVIGSRGQTGDFANVLARTNAFYAGAQSDAEMLSLLQDHRVAWVVVADGQYPSLADDLDERLRRLGLAQVHQSADAGVSVYRR